MYQHRDHGEIIAITFSLLMVWVVIAADTTGFFAGRIESVDVSKHMLNVKGETSTMTFTVAVDAKVYGADKKELALTDLKIGDEVTVDYTRDNGLAVARKITLKGAIPPPLPPEDKPVPLKVARGARIPVSQITQPRSDMCRVQVQVHGQLPTRQTPVA